MNNDFFAKKNIIKQRPVLKYVKRGGPDKRQHSHPHPEFIFVVNGSGRFETQDNQYPIKTNDVIICSKDVLHSEYLFDSPDCEMYHLGFDNVLLSNMEENDIIQEPFCIIHSGEKAQIISSYFKAIIEERQNMQLCSKTIIDDVLRVLLLTLLRFAVYDMGALFSQNKAFFEAKEYFDKNYSSICCIQDVCNLLNVNKYYITHVFKEQLGMPPIKYLMNKRLEKAKNLLGTTKLPISEIATKCGYTDAAYFCRIFKKVESITPLNFRAKVRDGEITL